MRFGAIDIGTNSIHLIVVALDPYLKTTQIIKKSREMVRLGAGDALIKGRLGKKAIARATEVIADFAAQARAAGAVTIRAVATSAVRDAENRSDLLDSVRAAASIDIEVLSGRDEARLIHLGVSRGFPIGDNLACIIDIGGGSTEFIVADAYHAYFLQSVPLGSLRLWERFASNDVLDVAAMNAHIERTISGVMDHIRNGEMLPSERGIDLAIGTSGTMLGLAALDAANKGLEFHRRHGYTIELKSMRALQATMLSLTLEERKKMPGMNPRRSDIIVAGNAIAIAVLEGLGGARVHVCDRALREGIVADFLQRDHDLVEAIGDERLARLDGARELAERFGCEGVHESHVAGLALQMYDTLPEPGNAMDRDVLFAAAIMHDVGRAIGVSGHHKHGAYIVRNSKLAGWAKRDLDVMAQVIRYHRKSLPKVTHVDYMALDIMDRKRVDSLAALLRIADGLDARRLGRVNSVRCVQSRSSVDVEIRSDGDVDAELSAALGKADLFGRLRSSMPRFSVLPVPMLDALETVDS